MEILVADEKIMSVSSELARPLVVDIVREVVERMKERLGRDCDEISFENLRDTIIKQIRIMRRKKIGRVINGTGILVHTNLGRAPLSEDLFDNIKNHITGYGNLEFEVASGKRGRRGELAEKYLALVSGVEAGTIVNNNAAALFIILNTFANRRKVVISRGELVQIGGGFRIPDIIRKSGAHLLEIGTTNITTLDDYRAALAEKPAMILKVHRSNFAVTGFSAEIDLKALVQLGREFGLPVVNDLGSGVMVDTREFAGTEEPTVQGSVRDGAALTCFSGDKLLGGVQAGLIVGYKDMVARIKKNPIYRVLRVDKTVFSAVEELLGYYLNNTWKEKIKLWRLAAISEAELYQKGRCLLEEIGAGDKISLDATRGRMGGGALPEVPLPSISLIFNSTVKPQKIADLFRAAQPPVIGRITDEKFMIDLKAIDDDDARWLVKIIQDLIDQL